MTARVPATYEQGVLRLTETLPLPEHSRVTVTVEFETPEDKGTEDGWQEQAKAALAATWDNKGDEAFNELAA